MLADESRHDQRQFINRPPVRARGASKTAHSARTPQHVAKRRPVLYMALALAAVAGLVCSPAAHGQQRPAPPLDPGAVKSRLVVRSVKGEKGPRQVVVLGKAVRVTDMLETRPFYRAEILPRELVPPGGSHRGAATSWGWPRATRRSTIPPP